MSIQVLYTPDSLETLASIYNFIRGEFGSKSADTFVSKAEKTINLISQFPLMFKSTSIDENIRIGFISKQTSLFYRVTDNSIQLLFFWDNRQEPILPQL